MLEKKTMRNGMASYQRTDAGVGVITLENPPTNAYSYPWMRDLDDAILEARFDAQCQVIVLATGGEKFFCAGADINMLTESDPTFKYEFCLHANETLLRLENTSKLVIAAIQGHCVGGGLEVAMAADLRVGAEGSAKLGLPEVALGVLPGTGGTQRLTRLIGRAKAMEWMVEGKLVSFAEAQTAGLLNKILPAENFLQEVCDYAETFCAPNRASRAVGLIKRAVQGGADLPLNEGLMLERELQQRLFTADDAKIGLAAYVQKTKAEFTGR